MKPVDCPLYNRYECSLCPIEDNPVSVWYSEDEICKNPKFQVVTNSMRKLKKKQTEGFFTLRMLNRNFIIRRGTRGLDPDLPETVRDPLREYMRREEKWILKHPEKKQLSLEELERRRQRMKSIREEVEI
ncbi:MAG: hypothetical protein QW478_08180 [Candidatus Micrarchaeaceae archaeon]